VKYGLFLGCTIPIRGQNYELATRAVAKELGIELVDVEDFACCGFPVKSTDTWKAFLIAARSLAVAGEQGLDIATMCNACTAVLTEVNKDLNDDEELRARVNKELAEVGREFKPGLKVRHFSRILYEEVGEEKLREVVKTDLGALRLAAFYGCHYLRPSHIYDGFDDAEAPVTLEKLIEWTGAKTVDYPRKLECCGGAILGVEEDIALKLAKHKLDDVSERGVDAMVTICPFCTVMLEDNQKKIEQKFEAEYNMPVLYYPQVLGLAMGMDKKTLGFRLNKVKAKALLEKIEGGGGKEGTVVTEGAEGAK
jgi:heterodisulfide reductase subunit B